MTTPKAYKVICISMYKSDLTALDAKVEAIKDGGKTCMSRSQLIRIALGQIEAEAVLNEARRRVLTREHVAAIARAAVDAALESMAIPYDVGVAAAAAIARAEGERAALVRIELLTPKHG